MKQEKLQLFTMDMKYVRDLHKVDDRVQSVSPQIHKSNRPFVGIVVVCNRRQYCIPLDHPKDKHYKQKAYKNLCAKELDWVQRNQPAIIKKANKLYRMITTNEANHLLRSRCVDFAKLERVLDKR